jgi:UPF0716 family protein affecting phage T7 exclusion
MDIAHQGYQENEARSQEQTTARVLASGSLVEGIAGAAAVALSIIGLAGYFPLYMVIIATIAVGAALLFEGGAISSRVSDIVNRNENTSYDMSEIGSGMTAEFLAGITGITLGILALIGMYPLMFVAISAIVFGVALMISSGTTARLNFFALGKYGNENVRAVAREALYAASSVQLLIGIASLTLGILSLIGIAVPVTLLLVAMLIVGFSDLLSGSAISSRMMSIFRRP